MAKHAILSPSSAERWLSCPASVVLCKDIPDVTSDYEAEGTEAHKAAEGAARAAFAGKKLIDGPDANTAYLPEMLDAAEFYWSKLIRMGAEHAEFAEAEWRIDLEGITGEPGAGGTADCVMLIGDTLHIVDFKYGKGVKVEVVHNLQLYLYAMGAYDTLKDFGFEINHVTLTIVQPRMDNFASWDPDVDKGPDLFASMRAEIKARAQHCLALLAGEAVTDKDYPEPFTSDLPCCRFCRAKGVCPRMAQTVNRELVAQFPSEEEAAKVLSIPEPDTPERLAKAYSYLDLIEGWCKVVRQRVKTDLTEGRAVPGYKLVEGRKGKRVWLDQEQAEATVKSMKLKVSAVYKQVLLSPTQMEKVVKTGVIGPRQWQKLTTLIGNAPATAQVVAESDPRPAIDVKAIEAQFAEADASDKQATD